MSIVFSPKLEVSLGKHIFPVQKYRLIKEKLIAEQMQVEDDFVAPDMGTDEEILLVHTPEYLRKVKTQALTREEELLLEFSVTPEVSLAACYNCGGTILACKHALEKGIGLHCGGGFHHGFPDHGEAFCVFNDLAIAIKVLQKGYNIKRVLVINCDLHQANGIAFIFNNDTSVFTFSIHQESGYPGIKCNGNMDIAVPRNMCDSEYLRLLRKNIPDIIEKFQPEIIMYNAGADSYHNDQLGGLNLTMDGLKQRDHLILNYTKRFKIPLVLTLAGGYASRVEDTVTIHTNTFKIFLGKE
jgi:acetoin utilization deacetylase AcuC-like enzyme